MAFFALLGCQVGKTLPPYISPFFIPRDPKREVIRDSPADVAESNVSFKSPVVPGLVSSWGPFQTQR